MNAFQFLDPLLVAPVTQIERGFLRAPKSFVLVVSQRTLLSSSSDSDSDESTSDQEELEYRRLMRERAARNTRTATDVGGVSSSAELVFFDVHSDAAKWLLNASYNSGCSSLKDGSANIAQHIPRDELVGPPRGEGATMVVIKRYGEDPQLLSFESAMRRDIFLRITRNFGDAAIGPGVSERLAGDNEDDDGVPKDEVIWDRESYEVPPVAYGDEVLPAQGVLSVALSAAKGSGANSKSTADGGGVMSQVEELHLAREMARNPLFNRVPKILDAATAASAGAAEAAPALTSAVVPSGAPASVFSLLLFQSESRSKISCTDIKIASLVVAESETWADMLDAVHGVDEKEILHLEARIESFSHEILSRRSVIEEIEKDSLVRQQIKRNLTHVVDHLEALNTELAFAPPAKAALDSLLELPITKAVDLDKCIGNGSSLARATATIEQVLATRKSIEKNYCKLQSIADRCEKFVELRRDAARRVRSAVVQYVQTWMSAEDRRKALSAKVDDTPSDSTPALKKKIVISMLPPDNFFKDLDRYVPLMPIIRASDLYGFYAVARCIAERVNLITTPRVAKFFLELRRRLTVLPSSALLTAAEDGQISFGCEETATTDVVLRLQRFYEFTPNSLVNVVAAPAADDPERIERPDVEMWIARDALTLLAPTGSKFAFFAVALDQAGVTAQAEGEEKRGAALKRFLRGRDPWMCRPDIVVALAAKAVTDLVQAARNFFVRNLKLMSADHKGSSTWHNAAAQAVGGSSAKNEEEEEKRKEDLSFWEQTDEVNTFLWLCFRRGEKHDLRASSGLEIGWELLRIVEMVFSKCDLIYSIPIASALQSLLQRIDDGDSISSTPLRDRSELQGSGGAGGAAAGDDAPSSSSSLSSRRKVQTPSTDRSGFVSHVLASALTIALEKLNLFVATQIESMRAQARNMATSGKVRQILPCFLVFPVALNRIETMLSQQFFPVFDALETFLGAIVSQMFATLDEVTFHSDGSLPARDADLMQFVHHSIFCAAVESALLPKTREALAHRLRFSQARRDQHEQRYVVRTLFARCFTQFAPATEIADGILRRAVNAAEAESSLKNAFTAAGMQALCGEVILREIPEGWAQAREKLKRNVSLLVSSGNLAVGAILRALVDMVLQHLMMHVKSSLGVMEHARKTVSPKDALTFHNSAMAALKELKM